MTNTQGMKDADYVCNVKGVRKELVWICKNCGKEYPGDRTKVIKKCPSGCGGSVRRVYNLVSC